MKLKQFLSMTLVCMAIASIGLAEDLPKVEVGKPAPDFVMTGIDGQQLKLSDKLGQEKNIVLMFSRAHW